MGSNVVTATLNVYDRHPTSNHWHFSPLIRRILKIVHGALAELGHGIAVRARRLYKIVYCVEAVMQNWSSTSSQASVTLHSSRQYTMYSLKLSPACST